MFGRNFKQTTKNKWSVMVWACFEEGNDNVLRKALNFVVWRRKYGQLEITSKKQVVKEVEEIGLEKGKCH